MDADGRIPKVGDIVELDTYPSKSEALRKRLDGHGDLVIATVRADRLSDSRWDLEPERF